MKTQIVIEVEGGKVTTVHCDRNADVIIIDHDDLGQEMDPARIKELASIEHTPEVAKPTRLKEIVKNIVEEHIQGLE